MNNYTLGISNYVTDGSIEDCKQFLSNYGYDTGSVSYIISEAKRAKENLRKILSAHPNWNEQYQSIIFNSNYNKGIEDYQSQPFINWMNTELNKRHGIYSVSTHYIIDFDEWTQEEYDIAAKISSFVKSGEPLVSTEMIEDLEEYAGKARINVGLKTTKAIQRLAKLIGLTEIKEMKSIVHNGVESMKDYGWNYNYALLCDALTPLKISRWTVISIHPLAYWTMSFGHKWASCHTIDKNGVRGYDMNGSHTYNGCYGSGTESYMLDRSTVIFYTVDPNYNEDELLFAPKMQRCNFHISETGEIMVQGRVYPDGRDGGDNSLAAQYRQTMQKILSECLAFSNLWTLKKGTCSCSEYTITASGATNYHDYTCYDDCNVSILKEIKEDSPRMVYIGHAPICPACGEEHHNEENILCECCADERDRCHCCGCRIDEYDNYSDGGGWYWCSYECMRNDGYVVPEDGEWAVPQGDCYYEEVTDTYWENDFYGVDTPGGWFHNGRTAEEYGYEEYEGTWYNSEDFEEDALTGERFPYWECTSVYYEHDGNYFVTEENMIEWIEKKEVA